MHLASRRGQIAGISAEPDGPGVTQLMRHATDAEDGCLRHRRFLIHDRDPLVRPAVRDTLPPADLTPVWCNKATEASVANRRGRVGCGPRVLNVASGHA